MGFVTDDRAAVSPSSEVIETASVFDVYDELLVPLCFQAYADDLAARLGGVHAGDVLVVACGTGVVRASWPMRCRRRCRSPPPISCPGWSSVPSSAVRRRAVTWHVADAQGLPYDDASFDVVVCQFGAMFFPSKIEAFTEAARVLRPQGRYELAVWDHIEANDFGATVAGAMRELFADDPPGFLERMPYSYHDADVIVADLVAGGLVVPGAVEQVGHEARAASPEAVAAAFCGGTPLRDQLQAGGPDRLRRALDGAARALAERFGSADLTGRTAALVATAVKA